MSESTARIVTALAADLRPWISMLHLANPLTMRFGEHPTLLRATVARLCSAPCGEVWIGHPDTEANRVMATALAGLEVRLLPGRADASEADLLCEVARAAGADALVVVDPRAPFVDPDLLRGLVDPHLQSGADLTAYTLAPEGIAGIVVKAACLRGLADAFRRLRGMAVTASFTAFAAADHHLAIHHVATPSHRESLSARLIADTPAGLERLARLAPAPGEPIDHARVLRELSAEKWAWADARRRDPGRAVRSGARPKILFAHYSGNREVGSTRIFERVLGHFDRDRFEISVALAEGELFEALRGDPSIALHRCEPLWFGADRTAAGFADDVAGAAALLDQIEPDAVLVSGTMPPLALACRLRGIPVVSHMHMPLVTLLHGRLIAPRAALHLYDRVIAVGESAGRGLERCLGAPRGRVVAIPNGTRLEVFDPDSIEPGEARRRLGLPADALVVAQVGFLHPTKQQLLLVEALARLSRPRHTVVAFAGGEHQGALGYRAKLLARAHELGVADDVILLGHLDDVRPIYAAADVVVSLGLGEQAGMVAVEAMAMRRPVVAVDDCGSSDLVQSGETGLLIPPTGEPDALAAALERLLLDPDLRAAMGDAGRTRARRLYDERHMVRRIEALMQEVMSES